MKLFFKVKKLALSEEARVNIAKCRQYLDDKMQTQQEPIYGINTGFGCCAMLRFLMSIFRSFRKI